MIVVELFIMWADHTWTTDFVDIPEDTEESQIESVARTVMSNKMTNAIREISGIALYHWEYKIK
jgi:hypothetical protein